MGTRHLIAVKLDGQYQVAQYGQWDGYPSGQGVDVLNFLREWDRPTFEAKLRASAWITEADVEAMNARIKREGLENRWQEVWPELSPDTGAKILEMVQYRDAGIKLRDAIDFAANSLMCEWAYVLDLDAGELEVYEGFNKRPLAENERFYGFELKYPKEAVENYYPIRKVASYTLDDLPTDGVFVKECDPSDEE